MIVKVHKNYVFFIMLWSVGIVYRTFTVYDPTRKIGHRIVGLQPNIWLMESFYQHIVRKNFSCE